MGILDLFEQMEGINRDSLIRAPINYMGSKYDSLENILKLLPYRKTWIEVFGGSGVVTLNRKQSDLEVLNDKWGGLTALYTCIQDAEKLEELCDRIKLLPHSREFFNWCKDTEEDTKDVVMRAVKAYYLIQISFAGRAKFFGRVTTGKANLYRKLEKGLPLFSQCHERLKKVQIEHLDWAQCIKDYDSKDTVFYLDPPYFSSNVYRYQIDHKELCDRIFKTKGFVALSGFDNEIYSKYKWDHVYSWEVKTDVATLATSEGSLTEFSDVERKARHECLWIKE